MLAHLRLRMKCGLIVQVAARYGSKPILSFTAPRSRVISLADYNVEKRLVLAVPHRMLLGQPEELPLEPAPKATARRRGGDDRGTARSEAVKGQSTITPLAGSYRKLRAVESG